MAPKTIHPPSNTMGPLETPSRPGRSRHTIPRSTYQLGVTAKTDGQTHLPVAPHPDQKDRSLEQPSQQYKAVGGSAPPRPTGPVVAAATNAMVPCARLPHNSSTLAPARLGPPVGLPSPSLSPSRGSRSRGSTPPSPPPPTPPTPPRPPSVPAPTAPAPEDALAAERCGSTHPPQLKDHVPRTLAADSGSEDDPDPRSSSNLLRQNSASPSDPQGPMSHQPSRSAKSCIKKAALPTVVHDHHVSILLQSHVSDTRPEAHQPAPNSPPPVDRTTPTSFNSCALFTPNCSLTSLTAPPHSPTPSMQASPCISPIPAPSPGTCEDEPSPSPLLSTPVNEFNQSRRLSPEPVATLQLPPAYHPALHHPAIVPLHDQPKIQSPAAIACSPHQSPTAIMPALLCSGPDRVEEHPSHEAELQPPAPKPDMKPQRRQWRKRVPGADVTYISLRVLSPTSRGPTPARSASAPPIRQQAAPSRNATLPTPGPRTASSASGTQAALPQPSIHHLRKASGTHNTCHQRQAQLGRHPTPPAKAPAVQANTCTARYPVLTHSRAQSAPPTRSCALPKLVKRALTPPSKCLSAPSKQAAVPSGCRKTGLQVPAQAPHRHGHLRVAGVQPRRTPTPPQPACAQSHRKHCQPKPAIPAPRHGARSVSPAQSCHTYRSPSPCFSDHLASRPQSAPPLRPRPHLAGIGRAGGQGVPSSVRRSCSQPAAPLGKARPTQPGRQATPASLSPPAVTSGTGHAKYNTCKAVTSRTSTAHSKSPAESDSSPFTRSTSPVTAPHRFRQPAGPKQNKCDRFSYAIVGTRGRRSATLDDLSFLKGESQPTALRPKHHHQAGAVRPPTYMETCGTNDVSVSSMSLSASTVTKLDSPLHNSDSIPISSPCSPRSPLPSCGLLSLTQCLPPMSPPAHLPCAPSNPSAQGTVLPEKRSRSAPAVSYPAVSLFKRRASSDSPQCSTSTSQSILTQQTNNPNPTTQYANQAYCERPHLLLPPTPTPPCSVNNFPLVETFWTFPCTGSDGMAVWREFWRAPDGSYTFTNTN
eukprot:gene986-2603_t